MKKSGLGPVEVGDAGCPAPSFQIPAGSFSAPGSSEQLTMMHAPVDNVCRTSRAQSFTLHLDFRPLLRACEVSAVDRVQLGEMVEHQGIARGIPAWKAGRASLNTFARNEGLSV